MVSSTCRADSGIEKAPPRCECGWLGPGAVSALSFWGLGVPRPQEMAGSPRTLTALNLLLLFMALCCFLVPQLLSASFQPQAA